MSKPKSNSKRPVCRRNKLRITESKLGRQQALGLWEKVNDKTSLITVDERLRGFQRLMIGVHESLHETCRDWTEEKVVDVSEFLARVLWECDYRHVDHHGEAKPSYKPPTKKKLNTAKTKEIWDTKNQS